MPLVLKGKGGNHWLSGEEIGNFAFLYDVELGGDKSLILKL